MFTAVCRACHFLQYVLPVPPVAALPPLCQQMSLQGMLRLLSDGWAQATMFRPCCTAARPVTAQLASVLSHTYRLSRALLQMTGPFGLPAPGDVQKLVQDLQNQLQAVIPRFQELNQYAGAAEVRQLLTNALRDRFMARAVRLVMGPQAEAATSQPVATPQPQYSLPTSQQLQVSRQQPI